MSGLKVKEPKATHLSFLPWEVLKNGGLCNFSDARQTAFKREKKQQQKTERNGIGLQTLKVTINR